MKKKLENQAAKSTHKLIKIAFPAGIFLFIFLVLWFLGLFRMPGHFRTVEIIDDNQISQYLSNVILPQLYNKSQLPEPFEITFTEKGVNEIVSRHIDANSLKKWGFSDISVTFQKGRILLTGKTVYRGFDIVLTAVFKPYICEKGFNAGLSKIQAGTSRVPFAAGLLRDKILYKLAGSGQESDVVHYAGVLLSDNKIPPEFSFDHHNLKVQEIIAENHKLTIRFLPD